MTTIYPTKVGENKETARIWLQGTTLERGGFAIATHYTRVVRNGRVVLQVSREGRYRVSSKKRTTPVIDIQNDILEELFGIGTKVKAVIRKGRIVIRRAVQSVKTHAREKRVLGKVARGETLTGASLFHGGGVMAKALHAGLAIASVSSTVAIASEIDSRYVDASLAANPELFTESSAIVQGPIQDAELTDNACVDYLEAGIPCTGASTSGRAKRKTAHAEEHAEAGAMFYHTLRWIEQLQPAVVVLENVKAYLSSASMAVVRSMLSHLDYEFCEMVLNGCDHGALENRDRMVVVAVSRGMADMLEPIQSTLEAANGEAKPATVAEALEPIAPDSDLWGSYDYLVQKQERDRAKGNKFERQLVSAGDASVPTLTRGMQKARSTDPFLQHPTDESLSRLFTPLEHARMKALPDPEGFIEAVGASKTTMHEILGQSVVYPVFEAVGQAVGAALVSAASEAMPESANDSSFGTGAGLAVA